MQWYCDESLMHREPAGGAQKERAIIMEVPARRWLQRLFVSQLTRRDMTWSGLHFKLCRLVSGRRQLITQKDVLIWLLFTDRWGLGTTGSPNRTPFYGNKFPGR